MQILTGKKQTEKQNIFPDSSRNYNTEIEKGMKKCRQSREEFTDRQTDTVTATKKKVARC